MEELSKKLDARVADARQLFVLQTTSERAAFLETQQHLAEQLWREQFQHEVESKLEQERMKWKCEELAIQSKLDQHIRNASARRQQKFEHQLNMKLQRQFSDKLKAIETRKVVCLFVYALMGLFISVF